MSNSIIIEQVKTSFEHILNQESNYSTQIVKNKYVRGELEHYNIQHIYIYLQDCRTHFRSFNYIQTYYTLVVYIHYLLLAYTNTSIKYSCIRSTVYYCTV